jgi:hypothetical protein
MSRGFDKVITVLIGRTIPVRCEEVREFESHQKIIEEKFRENWIDGKRVS